MEGSPVMQLRTFLFAHIEGRWKSTPYLPIGRTKWPMVVSDVAYSRFMDRSLHEMKSVTVPYATFRRGGPDMKETNRKGSLSEAVHSWEQGANENTIRLGLETVWVREINSEKRSHESGCLVYIRRILNRLKSAVYHCNHSYHRYH